MTIFLLSTGSLILFFSEINKKLIMIPNLGFVIFLLYNLIDVRSWESRYTKNMNDVMEKL